MREKGSLPKGLGAQHLEPGPRRGLALTWPPRSTRWHGDHPLGTTAAIVKVVSGGRVTDVELGASICGAVEGT